MLAVAVVALLGVVLLAAARVQADVGASRQRLRQEGEQLVAAETICARLAFLLATGELGPRSVRVGAREEILLDGTAYGVEALLQTGSIRVAIQDEAGLLNLNTTDETAVAHLLEGLGVARGGSGALAASLGDFVDEDEEVRINGAERGAYLALGLTPAPNHPLTSRWQAFDVLGWRAVFSGEARMRFWSLTTSAAPDTAININTAPAPVLEAVFGARPAAALVARRRAGAIIDLEGVEALTGAPVATAAGPSFRVALVFGGSRVALERRIVLGGPDAPRPVEILDEGFFFASMWNVSAQGGQVRQLPAYAITVAP